LLNNIPTAEKKIFAAAQKRNEAGSPLRGGVGEDKVFFKNFYLILRLNYCT